MNTFGTEICATILCFNINTKTMTGAGKNALQQHLRKTTFKFLVSLST